ncbi:hypothetical protein L2E82_36520 [Cichorium intybus]|uniref:Uncharacterized protein n=1 Tax=Cichorium intybus TaxID=13427 RepID=A0ACB9BRV7_CICIN|nr:hypothetical protein L2E82_36520 [Cichorium intybus]
MEEQIEWDDLINIDSFFDQPPVLATSSPNHGNSQSPLSVDDIEQLLLKDDDEIYDADALNSVQEAADVFFHDFLLDSPLDVEKSGEVVDNSDGDNSVEEQKNESVVDHTEEKENSDDSPNDPLAKKRKRQLRNKDAALRSRERKKMYVKDLEMKSRYYEAECKRLGSLLQCFMAENQALRFSLHSSKAYNVSTTKQESAVLFLESLLLGSLLWLVGIVCQLVLPSLHLQNPGAAQLEIVVGEKLPNLVVRKEGSKICRESLLVGKRFKASRSRMRSSLNCLEVVSNILAVF